MFVKYLYLDTRLILLMVEMKRDLNTGTRGILWEARHLMCVKGCDVFGAGGLSHAKM